MLTLNSRVVEKLDKAEEEDVVISVNNISKRFCRNLKRSLYYGIKDIMGEMIGLSGNKDQLREDEFWALKDISFTLKKGEAIGLVGANGAGKTTLLKIISGLIKPDTGHVKIKGRMAPLIGLGAGFNHVLSGRENVFINMSILGLTNEQINEKFDEVLNFSEIGDAIDAPVKTYSSGMVARLGFACAIHTDPDILLIDEVLAVGDIRFRMKCYRKLAQLRKNGTSFILVSHSSQSLLSVCESGVFFKKGRLISSGGIDEVISAYENDSLSTASIENSGKLILPKKTKQESFGLDFVEIFFKDEFGNFLEKLTSGNSAFLHIQFEATEKFKNVGIQIIIKEMTTEYNNSVVLDSNADGEVIEVSASHFALKLNMVHCCLKPGVYSAKFSVNKDGSVVDMLDVVESFKFTVVSDNKSMLVSSFYQPHTWEVF
jgi:lipopolysaccharide transport system ATP-binding protein